MLQTVLIFFYAKYACVLVNLGYITKIIYAAKSCDYSCFTRLVLDILRAVFSAFYTGSEK